MTQRRVRLIDLRDDQDAIARYEAAHQPGDVPAEVLASQRRNGIVDMEIHRFGNRLVMIMEVGESFNPAGLAADEAAIPAIAEWHHRMDALQLSLRDDGGWVEPDLVFHQNAHP
ncbi:MAG: L-rhamnose mutarotase [Sphingobium sp.]